MSHCCALFFKIQPMIVSEKTEGIHQNFAVSILHIWILVHTEHQISWQLWACAGNRWNPHPHQNTPFNHDAQNHERFFAYTQMASRWSTSPTFENIFFSTNVTKGGKWLYYYCRKSMTEAVEWGKIQLPQLMCSISTLFTICYAQCSLRKHNQKKFIWIAVVHASASGFANVGS